jgi:uncharacterized protein
MPTLTDFVVIAPLALVAGFAAQRGQICSVLAAKQLVETGRASRLIAFLYAMAWVVLLTVPLSFVFPDQFNLSVGYSLSPSAVVAGAIYGFGAFINGACLFGICSRSVSGSLHYFAALPGIMVGSAFATTVGMTAVLGPRHQSPLESHSLALIAIVIAALIAGFVTHRTLKGIRIAKVSWRKLLSASRWRSSMALSVIAFASGLLFALGDPASYATLLKQIGGVVFTNSGKIDPACAVSTIAMFSGSMLSRYLGGRFHFVAPTLQACVRSFAGGFIMSAAASAVPGGNDTMVLFAIPGLALNAVLAYVTMMVTLTTLIFMGSINSRKNWQTNSRPTSRRGGLENRTG